MKLCTKCGEKKPLLEFRKTNSIKSGLSSRCKVCLRLQDIARYQKFKMRDRTKEYYGNTDKERNKERSRRWRSLNKGRVNAQIAKRRATALQATPPWAEFEQIAMLYVKARRLTETTGVDHEVDHIVPLKNDVVCGLHCLSNLRILTADANNRKKCKLIGVV